MLLLFFCSALFLTPTKYLANATNNPNPNESNDTELEYVEEDQAIYPLWIGPGFYYGVWFENENDYNHWQSENQNRHQDRQNRNPQEGRHQGGGEYHGGGGRR